jgi:hypothetical protein
MHQLALAKVDREILPPRVLIKLQLLEPAVETYAYLTPSFSIDAKRLTGLERRNGAWNSPAGNSGSES